MSSIAPSTPKQAPSDDQSPPTLRLTIRFATHSVPDLPLLMNSNSTSTLLIRHLRHAIRPYLPSDLSERSLRLIHAGRVLEDNASIAASLRLSTQQTGSRWKGKASAWKRSEEGEIVGASTDILQQIRKDEAPGKTNIFERIYLHCSISPTVLSAAELAAEAVLDDNNGDGHNQDVLHRRRRSSAVTSAPAQGFDRLLTTGGFSAADVENLREQFRAIVSSRHTPDTMPGPEAMARMEEAWLENGGMGATGSGTGTIGGTQGLDDDDALTQMYDTLYGVCTGFFWPLGAVAWGLREEGVWSKRRGLAVLAGVGINIGFGLVRVLG